MPVTATLSRRFYERFGNELANEIVDWFNDVDASYRSEWTRINDANVARFEAKLEQRTAEVRVGRAWRERRSRGPWPDRRRLQSLQLGGLPCDSSSSCARFLSFFPSAP